MKTISEEPAYFGTIKDLCYFHRDKPEIIARKEIIDGEEYFLIFDDLHKKFYKLEGNAWNIWVLLDGQTSVSMIVDKLQESSSTTRKIIIKDVAGFISKLGRKGLIAAAMKKNHSGDH